MSSVVDSTTKGKKKKRVDQVRELVIPRRSPRLSQKYGRSRDSFPLATAVYSRPTLGTYTNESFDDISTVLNESGQSVPSSFDTDEDVLMIYHDHNYARDHLASKQGDGLFVTSTTERYPCYEQHNLYGLDVSDDEDVVTDNDIQSSSYFNIHTKEKILTPPKYRQHPVTKRPSFIYRIFASVLYFLYQIGALFYLTATLVLCWDVSILCGLGRNYNGTCQKSLRSLCSLLLVGFLVFIALTVPHIPDPPPISNSTTTITSTSTTTETVTVPYTPTPPDHGYDFDALRKEFEDFKRKQTLSFEEFKSYLLEFTMQYINKHPVLTAIPDQLNQTIEDKIAKERKDRERILEELKLNIQQMITRQLSDNNVTLLANIEVLIEKRFHQLFADYEGRHEILVKNIAKDIVNDAFTHLKLLLEKKINETNNSIGLVQSEITQQLQETYAEWREKLRQLEDKLKVFVTKEEIGDTSKEFSTQTDALKDEIQKLRNELNDLSVTIENLEQRVTTFEQKCCTHVPLPPGGLTEEFVRTMIDKALLNYSADQIAKFDFALESAGGHVVDSSDTYDPSETKPQLFGFTLPITLSRTSPGHIIQPLVLPGDCWCFQGTKGYALIKLATSVVVDAVTLQHLPKELSPDGKINSAVKSFRVLGKNSPDEQGKMLGTFEYKTDSTPIQTFDIANDKDSFDYVQFQFDTNHDSSDYTCVYRVRVHGKLSI